MRRLAHPTVILALYALAPIAGATASEPPAQETNCNNGKDDDGDSLPDCADADCFSAPSCQPDGAKEGTDARCSDWIDNDRDGYTDCDDFDCDNPTVSVCDGSWSSAAPPPADALDATRTASGAATVDLPGERNNFACADGIDNDGDGRIDCDDWGCQTDPEVTICRGTPGIRFSIGAALSQSYDFESEKFDTRFSRIQLRAFGPVPGVQESFFLLSLRAERTPRLVFALFKFPLGGGHTLGINSGNGGLSNWQVLSTLKNPLLDRPYYLYSAFDQGNGAAIEATGPITSRLEYRVFLTGGTGLFNQSVGGRRISSDEDLNYSFGGGVQAAYFLFGRFDRWDSRYLFRPESPAWTVYLGARGDQRADERYSAVNAASLFRSGRFLLAVEAFGKREFEFSAWQGSYNAMVGILAVPERLYFAADIGQFSSSAYDRSSDLPPEDEIRFRVAAHLYAWRTNGLLSLMYADHEYRRTGRRDRDVRLEAQIRF